jgi:hypothetical protein
MWGLTMRVRRSRLAAVAWGLVLGLCGGCAFGPRALERTHGRYNEAVRAVDEEEFLRNLVRLRYNENPSWLNVTSIAAQYELTAQAEARPFFIAPNPSNSNVIFRTFTAILPDVSASGSERPTVSLVPGDDGTAVRQFLTPISADTLIFLTQAGWPVSTVVRLWVERLNGVPNASTASNPLRDQIPDVARFQRIAELLQAVQDRELASVVAEERLTEVSGPLPAEAVTAAAAVEATKNGLEYRPRDDGKTWALVRRERRLVVQVHPGAESSPEMIELESLLNLKPGQRRYEVVAASDGLPDPLRVPTEPSAVLRLVPRSTAQVYYYLANGVEVPAEHLACGLVRPPVDAEGRVFDTREVTRGLFEVHVSKGHKPPPCAYVAVCYRGYWYYIDDRDQASKSAFGIVLQLSRLDFRRQQLGGPLLTLPAGR